MPGGYVFADEIYPKTIVNFLQEEVSYVEFITLPNGNPF